MKRKRRTLVAEVEVRRLPLSELNPHPKNEEIRRHPEPGSPEWEALRKSLAHDYFDPLVWNEANGFLVSGHLRRKILLAEGYTEADVVVKNYTEEEHLARMVAANREAGSDIFSGLKEMLSELAEGGVKADAFAMTPAQWDYFMDKPDPEAETKERKPPEEFPSYGSDIETKHECPSCGYKWS